MTAAGKVAMQALDDVKHADDINTEPQMLRRNRSSRVEADQLTCAVGQNLQHLQPTGEQPGQP
jgi:hypothetical protein